MAFGAGTFQGAVTGWRSGPTAAERLTRLRWLTTVAPAGAVFIYETIRHSFLEEVLAIPEMYGNLLTGLLALMVSFWFSRAIFGWVEGIQSDAVEETRRAAALASVIEERERLSRELHDGLAQVASYVLVRVDIVRNLVEAGRSPEATTELEVLRSAVAEVNTEVRESIAGLRSRVAERGLVPALEDYLEAFEERHAIKADLTANSRLTRIPAHAAPQLFRVVQEALTNVRRHSGAGQVHVALSEDDAKALVLTVSDDGHGFDLAAATASGRSYGLAGMRERTESLGGAFEVITSPGDGTCVKLTVPLDGQR